MKDCNNCNLCGRNKLTVIIENIEKKDLCFDVYNNEYCNLCNLNYKFTDLLKPINDYDIHRICFILFISKNFKMYIYNEICLQKTNKIKIWKGDKYFNKWYRKTFNYSKNKKVVKDCILLYYDNYANLKLDETEYKGDKHLYRWLSVNYFTLKNGIKW